MILFQVIWTLRTLITYQIFQVVVSFSYTSFHKNRNVKNLKQAFAFHNHHRTISVHVNKKFSLHASSSDTSRGFGGAMSRKKKKKQSISKSVKQEENQTNGNVINDKRGGSQIYSLPALYDLAFGYRNFESEVDFLVYAHETYSSDSIKNGPYSILELAAGPARHSITALSDPDIPITKCHAIDLSSDMVEYSQSLAAEMLPKDEGDDLSFAYSIMDMCHLDPLIKQINDENNDKITTFDSAWMLLGSMQHLLTNSDVIKAFVSIGSVVKVGGTLILELPHPRELFQLMECTRNGWEIPLENAEGKDEGELRVVWGDDNDVFNPILQQREFTVELKLVEKDSESGKEVVTQNVREVVPLRLFTSQEIDSLAMASGCWKLEKMFGALDEETDIEDDDLAFRMVCILRRE